MSTNGKPLRRYWPLRCSYSWGPLRLDAIVEAEAAVLEAEDARLIASDTNQGLGSPGRNCMCECSVISFGLVGVALGEAGDRLLKGGGLT